MSFPPTSLCDGSITAVNASGTASYHAFDNIDPAWAITVNQVPGATEPNLFYDTNLWYDTAGQDYSDNLSLGFDACALVISKLPNNTLYLGQDASGQCEGMLSSKCIETIQQRASDSAFSYTRGFTPGPNSNLSADALPEICRSIKEDLRDEPLPFPKECYQEFVQRDRELGFIGAAVDTYALTGNNRSGLSEDCKASNGSRSFDLLPFSNALKDYDNITRAVWPILTVFFPVANSERRMSWGSAVASMACLRANSLGEGSRVPPTLPKGAPIVYGNGLSIGASVGIVIGLVVWMLGWVGWR